MLSLCWYELEKKLRMLPLYIPLNPVNHITVHGKKFHKFKQAKPKTMFAVS